MGDTTLPYAAPDPARARHGRRAVFAFVWSLVAPAAALGAVAVTGDVLDDWFERPALFLLFVAVLTAAPLGAVLLGSLALGTIRGIGGASAGAGFAVAAIVLGWLQTVLIGWVIAIAWRL